jgi:hypothetical protein
MTDLETLVEKWSKEAGLLLTAPWLPELWKNFARLAIQYAAEEAAKVCEERAASHEEDAELEKDERYAVYAKHERRCAATIRERLKT